MSVDDVLPAAATVVGRYALFDEIASGGMATVHYGRLLGPSGFSRTVAIKKLHPHLARDAEFAAMFLDEARVAARVRHPNVVPTLDVVSTQGELFLVMEYVQGEALSRLMRASKKARIPMPPSVAAAIIVGVLHGLHAAHEAVNERGQPLNIVHRDVSPQNILIGLDGIPRLVDFGVAKATGRVQTTRDGQIKGKIAYMAPEQIRGASPTRLVDVYGASVVFWEMLTGERLFGGENEVTVLERALYKDPEAPSKHGKDIPAPLDLVVLRGLSREPAKRFQTTREMAREIENVTPIASVSKVGEWVESIAGEVIAERAAKVAEIESHSQIRALPSSPPPDLAPPDEGPTLSTPSGDIDIDMDSSAPPLPMRGLHRRRLAFIGAALLGVTLLIVTAFALRATAHAPTTQVPPPRVAATETTVPIPTATAVPSQAPTQAVTQATPSATQAKPTVVVTTAPHATIARDYPSARAGTKAGCNPPYTVDSNGVKQYKVDCL